MSDIIRYIDFSTVTSEPIIFFFASFNIAMHTTYAMDTCIETNENRVFASLWHGDIFQVYGHMQASGIYQTYA
jgi:hypothetical protein